MAEHMPKRERVMRASLKDAGESMSDYLAERAAARTAPAGAAAEGQVSDDAPRVTSDGAAPETLHGAPRGARRDGN